MDDLISRQELLESIEKVSVKGLVLDDDWVHRFVQEFPSIDAVPHWIPCEERLPEEGVVVVTVDKDGDYEINAIIDEEDCEWFWEKPVAWMPLPKPYEAERKES